MITAIIIVLLMIFVGIRFSKKYRKMRHRQWHVREWLKTIRKKFEHKKH